MHIHGALELYRSIFMSSLIAATAATADAAFNSLKRLSHRINSTLKWQARISRKIKETKNISDVVAVHFSKQRVSSWEQAISELLHQWLNGKQKSQLHR